MLPEVWVVRIVEAIGRYRSGALSSTLSIQLFLIEKAWRILYHHPEDLFRSKILQGLAEGHHHHAKVTDRRPMATVRPIEDIDLMGVGDGDVSRPVSWTVVCHAAAFR